MRPRYYLVSACLAGINSRYDGSSVLNRFLYRRLKDKPLLIVCPELSGGLPVPRPPVQITGKNSANTYSGKSVWENKARLTSVKGKDFTKAFLKGCKRINKLLKVVKIKSAFIKARSPSCGNGFVYNRNLKTGKVELVKGDGVFTHMLKKRKIPVKAF
ncbi:MAG: DUF523 domain-containing protein [Planctomycetes bacterium]|nr:DUF523 domain-containing protein [Planctomycetota bacterium]